MFSAQLTNTEAHLVMLEAGMRRLIEHEFDHSILCLEMKTVKHWLHTEILIIYYYYIIIILNINFFI